MVAEVMGGIEPTEAYVLELLRGGTPVVTANKQLVARSGPELFAAAAEGGVQLRFEASVCAAIPVIKLLRESLIVTNVHRVLGIVNGTTNFVLGEMEAGRSYADALAEAQRLGYAEADPTEDVTGLDAAAKMAILATVALGTRVPLEWIEVSGIDTVRDEHVGLRAAASRVPVEELLALGGTLEPHADNLAAALVGGVTLTWEGRTARIADMLPLAPVALVPAERIRTDAARAALPESVPHRDAAFTLARAALLGAGAASGWSDWFGAALEDRVHEPYRASALLDDVRRDLPTGAAGATLSGSGPTVIVWAEDAVACAAELAERYPEHRVLHLAVSPKGAHE
jgi:Homoserine dehydrogenase/Homoserine dehydrogenase, NAD binding domain